MTSWYYFTGYHIERVDVTRASEFSVWRGGRRTPRASKMGVYYPTYVEARAHMLQNLEQDVLRAKERVAVAEEALIEFTKRYPENGPPR